MTVNNNDPEKFIDDPEYFWQHHSWLLIRHKGNTPQTNTTQVSTEQLYGGSN